MTKKGGAQLDAITVLNTKFQLSTAFRFLSYARYIRTDVTTKLVKMDSGMIKMDISAEI